MPTSLCQRTALAAAISACFPAIALGAGVARVDFATGNVTAVAPDGRSRALSRGSEINVGETVATQQGRAQLRFADGAYMSLQPQTEFKVDEFKFSGKEDAGDNIVMSLLKGGMRTITGLIGRANRNNYRLRTDVATIGIRGTEYSVRYTNSIEVFCADGQILVQNEGGTLQLSGGQGGYVASNQTQPQQTENRPVLPPESPSDQQLNEPARKPDDPDNEIQNSEEGVRAEIETPTVTKLTGKFLGNVAVSWPVSSFFSPLVRDEVQVELDGSGALIAFDTLEGFGQGIGTQIGDATTQSQGNDGIIAWGRWINGTPTGDHVGGTDLSTEGAFHYVVGLPAANIPTTGSATYSMIGSTTPSFSSGISSASVLSSSLNVDFQWTAVAVQVALSVNGQTVSGSGLTSFAGNGHFGSSLSTSGPFCFQNLAVRGFLAGDGASRAGMAYHLSADPGQVAGAIAYERGALGPSGPNPFQQQLILRTE